MTRSVQDWFQLIQKLDDHKLAKQVLEDLIGHAPLDRFQEKEDLATLINVFSAIRLDQMVKEGSQ